MAIQIDVYSQLGRATLVRERDRLRYWKPSTRVPWSMLGMCALIGMLPVAAGWVTYQLFEYGLDLFGAR